MAISDSGPPPSEGVASAGRASRRERDRWNNDSRKGCEILITYADGTTRKTMRARGWSDWLRNRILTTQPGVVSAELIRAIPREEYRAIVEAQGARLRPGRRPNPAKVAAPAAPRVFGWELIIRQHQKVRTIRVAASTEDVALSLVMAIEGVDAATVLRPLSAPQFRDAAK